MFARKKATVLRTRTKKMLEAQDCIEGNVERRIIPGSFATQDLFGIFDHVIVDKRNKCIIGGQTTHQNRAKDHMLKFYYSLVLPYWLKAGAKAFMYLWSQGDNSYWKCNIVEITADDLKRDESSFLSIARVPRAARSSKSREKPNASDSRRRTKRVAVTE